MGYMDVYWCFLSRGYYLRNFGGANGLGLTGHYYGPDMERTRTKKGS